jgi:hypothetical protein
MEIEDRWEIKQESEEDKELVETNWLIGCWVVQERLPFQKAIGRRSTTRGDHRKTRMMMVEVQELMGVADTYRLGVE